LQLIKLIVDSGSNDCGGATLAAHVPEIKKEIDSLRVLKQSAAQATQSTGTAAAPLYTSNAKPSDGKSATIAADVNV
jgi:hypothetical protein